MHIIYHIPYRGASEAAGTAPPEATGRDVATRRAVFDMKQISVSSRVYPNLLLGLCIEKLGRSVSNRSIKCGSFHGRNYRAKLDWMSGGKAMTEEEVEAFLTKLKQAGW